MTQRILCIGTVAPEAAKILGELGDVTAVMPSQAELKSAVTDATILVTGLDLRIDKSVIDAAPNLQVIVTATTGLDHVDAAHAESKGIAVLSLRGERAFLNTVTPTAELACGLMIALVRNIPAAHASVLDGRWDRAAFAGHSLAGQTLGIVGRGRLGEMMQHYGEALGMTVVFTDPAVRGGVELEELLRASDVVSLHVHLTPDTEGMIGKRELAWMKPTAVLINTARGKIVDEAALLKALQSKKLAGYAADVLADELAFEAGQAAGPLIEYARTHRNVILTPHIGGMTAEARVATDVFMAQKLRQHLSALSSSL